MAYSVVYWNNINIKRFILNNSKLRTLAYSALCFKLLELNNNVTRKTRNYFCVSDASSLNGLFRINKPVNKTITHSSFKSLTFINIRPTYISTRSLYLFIT